SPASRTDSAQHDRPGGVKDRHLRWRVTDRRLADRSVPPSRADPSGTRAACFNPRVHNTSSGALAGLGLTAWIPDGEWRQTEVDTGVEGCIAGTDRPLTGVLFAYLDVVTGTPPSGPVNPTVDLQVRLFRPPRQGVIAFRARTLRIGRSLYAAEAE